MSSQTLILIVQGLMVLGLIAAGVRTGGLTIGLWGTVGVLLFAVVFGNAPGAIPGTAMLIILGVITAAGAMEKAGGVDWLVSVAARLIRRFPNQITLVAPLAAFVFTMAAGTGNIYYSLLPVIYEVAYANHVRPERPLALAGTASQLGITASPVSAAMAAMVGVMSPHGIGIVQILMITVPASLIGIFVGYLVMLRYGHDLEKDPEYLRRRAAGEIDAPPSIDPDRVLPPAARRSALTFIGIVGVVVLFGLFPALRPAVTGGDGTERVLSMDTLIELIMLIGALVVILVAKVAPKDITKSGIFTSGMVATISLFGVAWMANTFVAAHQPAIVAAMGGIAQSAPWAFALALFAMGALTTSQSSTTLTLMPIGLAVGIPPLMLCALWLAVVGIYFFPTNGSQIAAVEMDRTGTTRIGSFVINHSFLVPTVVCAVVSVLTGLGIASIAGGR
jgi:anaerobic C4-dicarboxylate transporter DcuA/anaerobic C4-dicarboxylate transporter DcuB